MQSVRSLPVNYIDLYIVSLEIGFLLTRRNKIFLQRLYIFFTCISICRVAERMLYIYTQVQKKNTELNLVFSSKLYHDVLCL